MDAAQPMAGRKCSKQDRFGRVSALVFEDDAIHWNSSLLGRMRPLWQPRSGLVAFFLHSLNKS